MSAHPKLTATFKLLFKLLLTAAALYIAFRKIEIGKTIQIVEDSSFLYVIIGILLYVISKIFSSIRLKYFFDGENIQIGQISNLKLYFVGMFYNLFLPGGIGGDGYKAIYMKRNLNAPMKKILLAIFLDRVSGMLVLTFFCCLLFLLTLAEISLFANIIVAISTLLIFPAYYFIILWLLKPHAAYFIRTSLYSILVQGIQCLSALAIFVSINLQDSYLVYINLFLVSSVFSAIPFTIGGIGARELAFVLAAEFIGIDIDMAIAFSILFFLVNVVSSLPGIFIRLSPNKKVKSQELQLSQ